MLKKMACVVLSLFVNLNFCACNNTVKSIDNDSVETNSRKEENTMNVDTEKYLNTIKELAENGGLLYEFNEEDKSIIITSSTITIIGGTFEEFMKQCSNKKEIPDDMNKVKDSMIDLCVSIENAKSKFGNDIEVNHIFVKVIERNCKKEFFVIKDGKIDYNAFEEARKSNSNIEKNNKLTYKARFGEFLECNEMNNTLVVKFKIEGNINNKLTIEQNGFNVEDLILNQGADSFYEIVYWAVADLENGSEGKVIQFTVDKNLINKVKNKQVYGNEIVDKAKNVWILPSLRS